MVKVTAKVKLNHKEGGAGGVRLDFQPDYQDGRNAEGRWP